MSSVNADLSIRGTVPPSQWEPYDQSVTSSAASSQRSVFSDTGSALSSTASSISDDFRPSQEHYTQASATEIAAHIEKIQQQQPATLAEHDRWVQPCTNIDSVPSAQRQHPRRSNSSQKPPPLVRQCERKVAFVDNLVDSATQMVEVIWPLSVVPCNNGEGASGRGVLPLRTYIEETLRRSRTSYSTLQVALYYLVLILPYVPKCDFTMVQPQDCPASRALMCGRRMFLAALILASKYLQDRNYSAKAWSKMSGLKVEEINANERTFLDKVCWKLHIPDVIFKRWTQVVLRYTPDAQPPSPGQSSAITWKTIVPLLTPELDNLPLPRNTQLTQITPLAPATHCSTDYGFPTTTTATPRPRRDSLNMTEAGSTSHESTPTPSSVLPRFLEPEPVLAPHPPALARLGPLPTPQMTPSYTGSSTPAVSAWTPQTSSLSSYMAFSVQAGINRSSMDTYPHTLPSIGRYQPGSRRPSVSTTSSGSSPESLISDRSRSSRASSISSVSTVSTTSSLAPYRACLARQATCRNVRRLPVIPAAVKEATGPLIGKPTVYNDENQMMCSSPEAVDFSISEKVATMPHRHSKHAVQLQPVSAPSTDKGRKRARPRGGRRSDLQAEVRFLMEEEFGAMEVDDDTDAVSPPPAAEYASQMLSGSFRSDNVYRNKEPQTPAVLTRRESSRVPMQKNDGKKRTCCSASAISASPYVVQQPIKWA